MSAVILMGGSVLALSQTRANPFSASDLLVLSNFIMSSESFLQSTESFTPVCLPAFNPAAFLYAYVAFLHKVFSSATFSMIYCAWKSLHSTSLSFIQLILCSIHLFIILAFIIYSCLSATQQWSIGLVTQHTYKARSCCNSFHNA